MDRYCQKSRRHLREWKLYRIEWGKTTLANKCLILLKIIYCKGFCVNLFKFNGWSKLFSKYFK